MKYYYIQNMKHFFSILFFSIAFIAPAGASPWWLFFNDEPGRRPGDTVSAALIERVSRSGVQIRTVSRYFNAVSVDYGGNPIVLDPDA